MPDAPTAARTLYLIDGHAQMFRSFYAIRSNMTSPVTGEPTNATFAFAGMLIKQLSQFQPQFVAMAIDTPGKTFRNELFPEYKANREAPPDEFKQQIPRMLELTELFGIPVIGIDGAEADDIMATIAHRLGEDPATSDVQVKLVSKDKDLEQLLTPNVSMFDIHKDETVDLAALKAKKGVTPEQVVDLLTLIGDTVDNIPGVKGVGPKTASKLIEEFGSLEGILENLDKIKGKRKENIEAAIPFFETARKLVELNRDVDMSFALDDAKLGGIDAQALDDLFKQLGFNRHRTDLKALVKEDQQPAGESKAQAGDDGFAGGLFAQLEADDDAAPPPPQGDYEAVTTREQLDELIATLKQQKRLAVDTETIGLGHRAALCGVCLAWKSGHGVYIPTASPDPAQHLDEETVLEALRPVLEDPAISKIGHNLKYDYLVLKHAGVTMQGLGLDTMVAGFLVGTPGQSMDHMAMSELGRETIPITSLIGEKARGKTQKTMDQVPLEQITPYAAEDADVTLQLADLLEPRLKTMGMEELATRIEMPLVEVLAEMEAAGIRVDPAVLDEQREALEARLKELCDAIYEAAGGVPFNLDSPKQLAEVLFTQLGLPVVKRTKTGPSTDSEVLEKLCDLEDLDPQVAKVPPLILEYRQLSKLVGTYLGNLKDAIYPDTGRIHASFHQTGAATGRLSSSGPNLQNIPIRTDVGRQIRKAFVAEPGHMLVAADYSQIELRVLAHLSEDAALIAAFEAGQDIHTAVAAQVFGAAPEDVTRAQRTHAKTINFGIIYGVTPFGLARRIEGMDVEGARKLIDDYKASYPGIDRFLSQCVQQAVEYGYVTTMFGRRREIPQLRQGSARGGQALGERLAINTVVQGSAADLIKLAMVNLYQRIQREQLPMKLLLQIHDELVVECPEGDVAAMQGVVEQEMTGAADLRVPLVVDAARGPDWFATK